MAVAVRTLTFREAINEALAQEMERDSKVVLMGEDVAGGAAVPGFEHDDAWGGVLGVTKGLVQRCGCGGRRHRPATGRRADVRGLLRRLHGSDLQPGREAALYVRRQGGGADGDPHNDRSRVSRCRTALRLPLLRLHAHARTQMRRAIYPCGR